MISLVRVDNRLLHGQVLEAWVPAMKAQEIVVADDAAAHSSLAMAATMLVLPPHLAATVQVVAEVDFAGLAASPRRALILLREISDLSKAVEAGLGPAASPKVNLGNVHYAPGRRPVTHSVFLSSAELESLRALAKAGFVVEAQGVPSEPPVGLEEMEHRYGAAH